MDNLERYRPLVDDWQAFRDALERPLPVTLWTNTQRCSPSELSELLRADGLRLQPISWLPGAFRLSGPGSERPGLLWPYRAGLFHLQEEVSMIPAVLLESHPGERILDLCAAPGGKSLQVAASMSFRGTVVANDLNGGRLAAVKNHLQRLGLTNVSILNHDASNLPRSIGQFDRILCDVPCSCEGTSRKNPRILGRTDQEFRPKLVGSQRAILRKALQLVRVRGRVVYSTCTYAPEENEAVVDELLQEFHGHVRLVPARLKGLHSSEGLREWEGRRFDDSLRQCLRVWPHQNDTGGFFVAVFEKTSQPEAWDREPWPDIRPYSVLSPKDPSVKTEMELLKTRFGIEAQDLGDLSFHRGPRQNLWWVNRDHRPPSQPAPQWVGQLFLRADINHPKLPTGTSNLLASKVRRNVVELERDQLDDYFARRPLLLQEHQLRSCQGDGYVVVRYRHHGLGQGLLCQDGTERRLHSMFPKGWH